MSQKARKKKAKIKKVTFKDKYWFTVKAPKNFNYQEIAEVIGLENNVLGRTVEILLYDITGDYNDISLKLKFKINNINTESKTCESIFIGHEYTNDYIRSLIGRGSSKVTSIINLITKDGYTFRLTVICTTIRRARSSQQLVIRKIMTEILREFAKSLNHEKFITGMIYGEFQNQIQRIAKTIYPLSNSTIIKSKLISIPEGGEDKEYITKDEEFELVEVEVKRTRKSEIKRTERINVKKYAQEKTSSENETEE
ncbi:MAG: 30S ribosomal protein S3ae [Candidatus Hodarchaeota archaeon]